MASALISVLIWPIICWPVWRLAWPLAAKWVASIPQRSRWRAIRIGHRQLARRLDRGDPIAELEAVAEYMPQMDDYVTRALDPDAAPSYGVPGDE